MPAELDSHPAVVRSTQALLDRADALGRLPTPVNDIVRAAGLTIASDSHLDVGTHLAEVPEAIWSAVSVLSHKVRAIFDRDAGEIHLSPSVTNPGQRAFVLLHEVCHGWLPWYAALANADDYTTLSPRATAREERECNLGASELLFQGELLTRMASQHIPGFVAIHQLARMFGASIHATFRRYVETHHLPVAGLVLMAANSNEEILGRRESICSTGWAALGGPVWWPRTLAMSSQPILKRALRPGSGGDIERGEWFLSGELGRRRSVPAEVFNNGHHLLVLLMDL
jgi:hypothetical protein